MDEHRHPGRPSKPIYAQPHWRQRQRLEQECTTEYIVFVKFVIKSNYSTWGHWSADRNRFCQFFPFFILLCGFLHAKSICNQKKILCTRPVIIILAHIEQLSLSAVIKHNYLRKLECWSELHRTVGLLISGISSITVRDRGQLANSARACGISRPPRLARFHLMASEYPPHDTGCIVVEFCNLKKLISGYGKK